MIEVDERLIDLANRLIAPGPKAAQVSCKETHEIADFIFNLANEEPVDTKTLTEITDATRRGEPVSVDQMRYAICAYDVLLANMKVNENATLLEKFFIAAEKEPKKYIGWDNDPENPDFVAWHKAFINITG